jgi:hypothetical protein
MARKNVLVEIRKRPEVESALSISQFAQTFDSGAASQIAAAVPSLSLDPSFPPVGIPPSARTVDLESFATSATGLEIPSLEPDSVLVRGTIDEAALTPDRFAAGPVGDVVAIFADPVIEPCLTCGNSPPLGTSRDVARLLDVPRLTRAGMDGSGVLVAIVDGGINLAHLQSLGLNPKLSSERSWVPERSGNLPPLIPGQMPVGHGTMCAFDALIAAPNATLLDIAVLQSRRTGASAMDGLLSDAVLGYSFLVRLLREMRRPGDFRSLVVSNSWGMFQQSWDLPPGHPGNYSHNLAHPFNRIVGTLERAGADILFAAGNCGRECPDSRCGSEVDAGIYGANSHPAALSIGGVDLRNQRVGYSTCGPGHLDKQKPDVCGYTHFAGSGVYPADGGTSAATPVVAGLVAAFRSRFPSGQNRTPAALRDLIRHTARNLGSDGFDFYHGFGVVSGSTLAQSSLPLTASGGSLVQTEDQDGNLPQQLSFEGEIMDGNNDQEFMQALQAFGGSGGGGADFGAGAFQNNFGAGNQDQEFMQALSAFGGGGTEMGAGSFAGAGGGLGGGQDFGASGIAGAGGGFGGAQDFGGGSDDQAFMQALAAFGGAGGGAMGQGAMGATAMGAGGATGGMPNVAAAPSLAQICAVYRQVRPVISGVLRFISVIPGIGGAAARAVQALMSVLDAVCSGRGALGQVCQVWRQVRPIVARIIAIVARIPFIGSRAAAALRTLMNALNALCP